MMALHESLRHMRGHGLEKFQDALLAGDWGKKMLGLLSMKPISLSEAQTKAVQPSAVDLQSWQDLCVRPCPSFLIMWCDQGPLNMCAGSFMLRKQKLNVMLQRDEYHRYHNDFHNALQSSQLYSRYVESLAFLNINYGPWSSAVFFNEVLGACECASSCLDPQDSLLLLMWPRILEDGASLDGAGGIEGFEDSESGRKEWLLSLPSRASIRRKGMKTSTSRWFSWTGAFNDMDREYHSKLFGLAVVGLTKGWLKSKEDLFKPASREQRGQKRKAEEDELGGSASAATSSKSNSWAEARKELQDMRQRCHNSLHLACQLMADIDMLRSCRIIHLMSLDAWSDFNRMVQSMRGPDAVVRQRLQWRAGAWCDPLCACLERCRDVTALRRCGMDGRNEMLRDVADSWAGTAGRLQVAWIAERSGSMLPHLAGYPERCVGLLGNVDLMHETMHEVKGITACYAEAVHCTIPEVQELVRRHPWQDNFMKLVVAYLSKTEFSSVDPALEELLHLAFGGFGQSRMMEEINQRLRDAETRSNCSKTQSLMHSWEVLS
eukprot:5025348-Amphidinium_carterae.3